MEFQAFQPATENALSAKDVLVLVTLKSPRADCALHTSQLSHFEIIFAF